MNAQLSMENIGDLHGVSHESVSGHGELLSGHSPHSRPTPRGLGHRTMGMATLLDCGDYHPGHPGHLHPAISMCEAPPGMSASSHLHHPHPSAALAPHLDRVGQVSSASSSPPSSASPSSPASPTQRIPGNVSGSFTLMREDRSLAPMNSLYPAYHHKDPCMGQSLSPLSGSGLASIHTTQAGIPPYAHPGAAIPGEKMLTPSGFEAHHPAMLGRHAEQHMSSSAGMVPINGLHHHPHAHLGSHGHGQGLGNGREQASGHGQQGGGGGVGVSGGQMEEGTLSDLLRNPKPWSKLKSGRETFRRMWKWLQEPEFQRMSALRLAACKRKEQDHGRSERGNVSKKPRLVFTDVQRRTLHAIFKENKRPSKELQVTIAQQLGLELATVSNFFMNARRRALISGWMTALVTQSTLGRTPAPKPEGLI
ncbi:unnamed protein product [Tetraodon nigroviridis]|uniref:One cut domain family member n=1 Tax=Tetraodon nigroviridis TaxID=99883 RepID=Q4SAG4_TETNG|nr:unnamed protein product [Tetraodon nigroviridis]